LDSEAISSETPSDSEHAIVEVNAIKAKIKSMHPLFFFENDLDLVLAK
jgi:hypothetical protein